VPFWEAEVGFFVASAMSTPSVQNWMPAWGAVKHVP
jgi:hypothetical protein